MFIHGNIWKIVTTLDTPVKCAIILTRAGVAHLVERHLAKVEVASSSLVARSRFSQHMCNDCSAIITHMLIYILFIFGSTVDYIDKVIYSTCEFTGKERTLNVKGIGNRRVAG